MNDKSVKEKFANECVNKKECNITNFEDLIMHGPNTRQIVT